MKITFIGCTHNQHHSLKIEPTDILIHTGDYSGTGTISETNSFLEWFSKQPAKHIVFTNGNHDFLGEKQPSLFKTLIPKNVIYVEHNLIEIEGLKIFLSPYSPFFFNWAFNVHRGEKINRLWQQIPPCCDVVVIHGPVYGILDKTEEGDLVGCEDLKKRIEEIQPLIMACSHIHEAYGYEKHGNTWYLNASILDRKYHLVNKPIVVEIDENKNIKIITDKDMEETKVQPIKVSMNIQDLLKADIRVCKILDVELMTKGKGFYQLKIDTGVDERTVISRIADKCSIDKLLNKNIPFVLNFEPKEVNGVMSHGMIFVAEKDGKIVFSEYSDDATGSVLI